MKVEDEKKIAVKFHQLNEYIYSIENLPKWVHYIDDLENMTMTQDIKNSIVSAKVSLFRKKQDFQFRIREYEKNKKIRLKSVQPYFFEITVKTLQAVDGSTYVTLKTKAKPQGLFLLFGRKKLRTKNRYSLEILEELFAEN